MTDVSNASLQSDGWHVTELSGCASRTEPQFSMSLGPQGYVVSYTPDECADSEYTGPLDLVPGAVFAWSQQALSASFTDPAIRLILDDVGESEQDFAPTDDHSVSISAVNTFKGENNAFHMVNYDQTGNGYNVDDVFGGSPPSNKPGWAVIGASPLPAFGPRAAIPAVGNFPLGADAAPNLSGGMTIFLVAYVPVAWEGGTNEVNAIQAYSADFNQNWQIGITWKGARFIISEDVVWDGLISVGGLHLWEWVVDAAGNTLMLKDGVDLEAEITSGSLTAIPSGAVSMLEYEVKSQNSGDPVLMAFYGGLCWPGALSAPNRLLIRQNMQSIFGTPALP
jgi:hypothetical protein